MDETDGNRVETNSLGKDLTPAIRRVGDPENRQNKDQPFGDSLTSAVRRVNDDPRTQTSEIEELIGPPQTLEPEIQGIWVIQSTISAAVLGIIAAIAFSMLSPGGPWVGGVVFGVSAVLGVVLTVLRYRIWTYQVRSDSLYLRRGVLTRINTVAPYVRIQHVDTRRGPLERTFGLATTVVYTAGSRGADVSIPGLTPERADDLQARLKQLAIAAEGEDAV
jgi:membrane protein YdbS with pleckstrin-like domain